MPADVPLKKRKKERNWERIEWFTRSKLIVLVCFRTTMVLCAFNSIAPLVVVIEFRFRSSSSSTHIFARKPDPVRLKSKRVQFFWQLHYFTNINSQRLNSKLGNCFLKSTWKSSQTIQVPMEREGRLHCLKLNWISSIIKIILNLLQSRYNSVNLTICIDCCLSSAVYLTIPD